MIENRLRFALTIIAEELFYICSSGKSADFPELLFYGKGRNDKQHKMTFFFTTPSREKANKPAPQGWLVCNIKNNITLNIVRAKRRQF